MKGYLRHAPMAVAAAVSVALALPFLLPDGEAGELVLTTLTKEALPVLRYRTRDLTRLLPGTARSMRRIEKVTGRSDDMMIVRGVNVFPSAVREIVGGFAPEVSGHIAIRRRSPGVKQDPPLPVRVELAQGGREDPALAEAIGARVRDVLVVQADVELVPWGSLRRSEYKSKLIED